MRFSPVRRWLWRRAPAVMLVARYVRIFRRWPDIRSPRTFNEHILAKLLFDRDPRLTVFADKFAVRDFVKDRLGGNEHLTTLYAVIDDPAEIARLALPGRFVMKPTHMSGAFEIVRDATTVDRVHLEKLASSWLETNYGVERGEWAYRNVKPRVLFEELLEFEGNLADDYTIYCFAGEPQFVRVIRGKFGADATITMYDRAFRLLPVTLYRSPYPRLRDQTPPPQNFQRMLEIAAKLSEGTDFVRVDLYNLGGRIVFGELTNYPHAGTRKLDPPVWEERLGSYWPARGGRLARAGRDSA